MPLSIVPTPSLSPQGRGHQTRPAQPRRRRRGRVGHPFVFTRYSFTPRLFCTNQPDLHPPRPPTMPTLVQYYCTIIGQYTTPLPTSRLYSIHHARLVITISCKGQVIPSTASLSKQGRGQQTTQVRPFLFYTRLPFLNRGEATKRDPLSPGGTSISDSGAEPRSADLKRRIDSHDTALK